MYRLFLVGILATLLASEGAVAATAELELDFLSFFYFEGAEVGASLPAATIPLEIERTDKSTWSVHVPAASFAMPEVTYPSGSRVEWRLTGDATGTISISGGALVFVLSAPAMAYVDGSKKGIPWSFEFTTETTAAAAKGITASRQGARIDPGSGYVQLVAAGVHADHAATAPGKPYYAVLSGRIQGYDFSQ